MTPPDREPAGRRIAWARRRRGLSQAVLAGLVGRSESWLSDVLTELLRREHRPSTPGLRPLARRTGVI